MNTAAMKLLYLVVLMGCCGQGIAQIQACYDGDRSCVGNVITGVNSARDCCLGSGFSFRNSAGTCRQCIVHGFTTTSLNVSEGDPLQRIEVSLDIKGNTFREPPPATESFGLQVRCIDSGGPQTVSSNDFTENGCGENLTLNIDTNPLFELGITFEDDNRLEGTEILEVQIALDDATQTAVSNSGNIFFRDTLSFSVADITVVEIGFSEDDYTADEGEPTLGRPYTPCRVTVEVINGRLELPLPIQLTPRAGNATVADFNDTIIETEIPEGQTQQAEDIQIFDDEINEAPEAFDVLLDVLSEPRSNVIFRIQKTLCRIRQSDPIEIGFTRERIIHLEQFGTLYDEIINKSRVSEQTFQLQIEISTIITGSGLQTATQDEDFAISLPNTKLVYSTLAPSESNLVFGYIIYQDNRPENTEVFQVSVTPDPRNASNPSFDCNRDNGCYRRLEVRIEDDDVAVVGFVETLVDVNDTDGQATLNIALSAPQDRIEIMFFLIVESLVGSAGPHDGRRGPPTPGVHDFPWVFPEGNIRNNFGGRYNVFDETAQRQFRTNRILNNLFNQTQRSQKFTLPIYIDDVPEGVEELNLTLSLQPGIPTSSVNVTPAVATVRIHDLSTVVVGFDVRLYTVGEQDGPVEVCVNVTEPRRQDIGTVTFNLSVETQDGSAVSNDDYTSVSMTVGTFTSQRPRQCFSISITNDATIEQTELFTTRLTLIPASVRTINASRIIVDPPETTVRITDNDFDLSTVDLPKPTVQITDKDLSPTAPTVTCPPCEPDTRTPEVTCPPVITCPTVAPCPSIDTHPPDVSCPPVITCPTVVPCPSIDTRPPEVTCPPVITCPTVVPCPSIDTWPPEVSCPPVITSPTTRPTLLPDTPLTQTDDEVTDVTMPPISTFITPSITMPQTTMLLTTMLLTTQPYATLVSTAMSHNTPSPTTMPKPPPTASKLTHITSKLPPTTSKSPPTTSKSSPTTSKLPPTTSKPPPTSKSPPTTSKSPPTTSKSPPTTSKSPPTTSKSPPTTSKSPPTTSKSPPTTSKSPPTTSKSSPTTSKPSPTTLPTPSPTMCHCPNVTTTPEQVENVSVCYDEEKGIKVVVWPKPEGEVMVYSIRLSYTNSTSGEMNYQFLTSTTNPWVTLLVMDLPSQRPLWIEVQANNSGESAPWSSRVELCKDDDDNYTNATISPTSPSTPTATVVTHTTLSPTTALPTTPLPTTMYTQRPTVIIKPGIIKNMQVVNMEAFWNPPSETGGEITSYLTRIRYTRSDGRRTTKYKRIRDPTVRQWKPDPFPSERPVYFQVRATNSAGYGPWSKQIVLAN